MLSGNHPPTFFPQSSADSFVTTETKPSENKIFYSGLLHPVFAQKFRVLEELILCIIVDEKIQAELFYFFICLTS